VTAGPAVPGSDEWLQLRVEQPIDATQRICDPHHHLWARPGNRYVLDDLRADTGAGHGVERTVFVECMAGYRDSGPEALRPIGETEFVAAQAAESARTDGAEIAGIVGFADLTLGPAVAEVLEAHVDAGGGRFRGIRHASSWDPSPQVRNAHTKPPPGLLGQPAFRDGVAVLGRMGLRFDAWLYHTQLGELVDLARAEPEVTVVLNHLGAPLGVGPYAGRRDEVLRAWRAGLAEVASCPNVALKLGGIGMPLYGFDWHERAAPPSSEELAAAWGDPIRWCIDTFGPSRCMFESNFPVDRQSCSYTVLWNSFQRIAERYTTDERSELFHDTAVRTYGL
jgi:L-fuconolactonase